MAKPAVPGKGRLFDIHEDAMKAFMKLLDSPHATDAPCIQDPEMWWSFDNSEIEIAKVLCGSCPIKNECAEFAYLNGERSGVWGGFHGDELRIARQRELRASRSRRG